MSWQPRHQQRKLPCVVLVAWSLLVGQTYGQEKKEPAPGAAAFGTLDHAWWSPPGGHRELASVQNCYLCHNKTDVDKSLPPGILPPGGKDDFWVLLNELNTWANQDKHYQAYAVLHNDRSRKMAKTLGLVDADGNSIVHRDKRCLACHSAWPVHQLESDERGLIADKLTTDPRINLGVSCEGCHGPSLSPAVAPDKNDGARPAGWNDIHRFAAQWRFLSPQKKFETYGFWNVRSPVNKARICLSCHLGNVEQGKILTHEMYAAGHPPLPGFEIETFIDQEPQHWRNLKDKKADVREEFLKETQSEFQPENLYRTREMLIGALVGLSEMLRLNAALMDNSVTAPVAKPEWPELASFSCFACHHDLASPAWRQQRTPTGRPGRPFLYEWPEVLTQLALKPAGADARQFQNVMRPLRASQERQPFGDPATFQPASRTAAQFCFDAAVKLESTDLTPAMGRELLQELCRQGQSGTLDYDSARMIVWASRIIYEELRPESRPRVPGKLTGWYRDEKDLDKVEELLASLSSMFILDLRDGRKTEQLIADQQRPQTEVELQKTLPFVSRYAPDKFQAELKKLSELLASQEPRANP